MKPLLVAISTSLVLLAGVAAASSDPPDVRSSSVSDAGKVLGHQPIAARADGIVHAGRADVSSLGRGTPVQVQAPEKTLHPVGLSMHPAGRG